jgi:TatD DNase family protein
MYQGIYNGTKKHEPDLDKVLQRAFAVGLQKIFITAGNLEEAHKAVKLVREVDTAGMHIDKVRL